MTKFNRYLFSYLTEQQARAIVTLAEDFPDRVNQFDRSLDTAVPKPLTQISNQAGRTKIYTGGDISKRRTPIELELEYADGVYTGYILGGVPHLTIRHRSSK